MIFKTISGSTYEYDESLKRIRRLYGNFAASTRQGNDGEWKQYKSITPVIVGSQVLIVWDYAVEDDLLVGKSTLTSPVKEILTEEKLS